MVEATQTNYATTGPTTGTYDANQTSGIKGKLAQLKGKLSGHPTNDPYLGESNLGATTTQQPYLGTTGLTTQQQPQLQQQQPILQQTTAAPYPTGAPTSTLGSTLGPQLTATTNTAASTAGFGGTGLGPTGQTNFVQPQQPLQQEQQFLGASGLSSQRSSIVGSGGAGQAGFASSGLSSQRSSVSVTDSNYMLQQQQQPQQQQLSSNIQQPVAATEVIQERPVLDRVEKIIQKEVVQKPRIQEQIRQDIIEVREKPIEKRFMHPVQEFRVQEQTQFEIQGKEAAEMERNNLIYQLRERDRLHQVTVDQRQDVKMFQEPPLMSQSREMRKEVIYKPIVTEIHEQPIREIHEQQIQRTIYEKPIVTVIRDQSIIENISSNQPLTGINYQATPLMTRQQQVIAQPILTQPVVQQQQQVLPAQQNVVIEKQAADTLPHVIGTNLNPSEVDRMENQTFLRK